MKDKYTMKKITVSILFILFMGLVAWQNRVNITVWATSQNFKYCNSQCLSVGSSNWQEGPSLER